MLGCATAVSGRELCAAEHRRAIGWETLATARGGLERHKPEA